MSSDFGKEAQLRREAFVVGQVAKMEALKKTINKAACREELLDGYAKTGCFHFTPLACVSVPLHWSPDKKTRSEFEKRNPGYFVSRVDGEPSRIFATEKFFQ